MVRTLRIREFPIDEIPRSCSWTIVAPPGKGKSNLIKYLAYVRRHVYPVAKVHSGTEDSNKSYETWLPRIFINDGYDEPQEKNYIIRQKRCLRNGCRNGSAINIIDDCSEDNRIYKSPIFQGLYKNGSRHWNGLIITALQYGIDFPPAVRSSSMYVALGFIKDQNEREKLYKNFGGLCGSLKDFCSIMDQIIQTKDEYKESFLSDSALQKLYDSLLYQPVPGIISGT